MCVGGRGEGREGKDGRREGALLTMYKQTVKYDSVVNGDKIRKERAAAFKYLEGDPGVRVYPIKFKRPKSNRTGWPG